jgi:hypothetical protein
VERGERNLTLKNIAAFSQALGLPASKLLTPNHFRRKGIERRGIAQQSATETPSQ